MAIKVLIDYIKRGPFNDIDTPDSATDYLIPSLQASDIPDAVIWESAPPLDRSSKLQGRLTHHGYNVMSFPGIDYFQGAPDRHSFDVIVTNPPFSLKEKWVARTMEFNKPWALLLPIAALGVRRNDLNVHLSECQILLPPRRIDFTGKKAPWMYCAWFTWGFDLPYGNLIPVDDQGHALEGLGVIRGGFDAAVELFVEHKSVLTQTKAMI